LSEGIPDNGRGGITATERFGVVAVAVSELDQWTRGSTSPEGGTGDVISAGELLLCL